MPSILLLHRRAVVRPKLVFVRDLFGCVNMYVLG